MSRRRFLGALILAGLACAASASAEPKRAQSSTPSDAAPAQTTASAPTAAVAPDPAPAAELPPRFLAPPPLPAPLPSLTAADVAPTPMPSLGWAVLRMTGAVLVVGALMVGGLLAYRRFGGTGNLRRPARAAGPGRSGLRWFSQWIPSSVAEADRVQVVSRSFLGPKESICVVQAGRERFLVATTGAGISLLGRLETPEPTGEDGLPVEPEPTPVDFARALSAAVRPREAEARAHGGRNAYADLSLDDGPIPLGESEANAIHAALARSRTRLDRLTRGIAMESRRG